MPHVHFHPAEIETPNQSPCSDGNAVCEADTMRSPEWLSGGGPDSDFIARQFGSAGDPAIASYANEEAV
jgi:hypothetical protein